MQNLYRHSLLGFLIVLGAAASSLAQSSSAATHKIHIKVSERLAQRLSYRSAPSSRTGSSAFDVVNEQQQVKLIRRVFPPAGKYEAAHRFHGLHRWYEVVFEDSISSELMQVVERYQHLAEVSIAEPVYPRSLEVMPRSAETKADPEFGNQWHYQNTGQNGGTPGADIRLSDAWKLQVGSDEVVVAIIDGGMDPTHDDLAGAMWINEREANGQAEVDDDNNGYVDDIYGYGFGDERGDFYPHYHGVHVGGTVGAVSNNGVGVAGVAGGRGAQRGVRLMSCAVFGKEGQGGFASAFVYAADNGAVIAQNSWGGGSPSDILEDAIAYFVARAGYDNTEENFDKNVQVGPMAGGLVIFAAGNNGSEEAHDSYPASLPSVLAVASTDHNDQRSPFSNYGDWVDIAAPGSGILSTYTNNGYGYLSGTSMACPQVSGVAALLVAQHQAVGLHPSFIRQRLLQSADNIDSLNPGYKGKLGQGRLNAFRALSADVENDTASDQTPDSLSYLFLTLQKEPHLINLEPYFQDVEKEQPTYTVHIGDEGVVSAFIKGTSLSIITRNVGATLLDIRAQGDTDSFSGHRIQVAVYTDNTSPPPNLPPVAAWDQQQYELAVNEQLFLSLDSLFSDPENRQLSFHAIASAETVGYAEVLADRTLHILALQPGELTIGITATDPQGAQATTTLFVNIRQPKVLAVDQLVPANLSLAGFPNPLEISTTITYSLIQRTHVRLQVYGMDGILHCLLLDEEQSAGAKTLWWNTSYLPPGLYILKLTTTDGQKSIKLVKQ